MSHRARTIDILPGQTTRIDFDLPAEEYQAHWWTLPDSDAFSAIGNHGQFIYVDPVSDIVIARFGRTYGSLDYLGWPALFDDLVAALQATD